jgi:polygalacturonase
MKADCSHLSWLLAAAVVGVIVAGSAHAEGQSPFHDIRDYGAVPNDDVKDTEAIRKAIAGAAHAGGGTVYVPAGRFVSGSIHLKSNITLHLDAGAVLAFSQDFDDYLPMVPSRWEGTECFNFSPPIYAYRAENIAIVGRGLIDGQGRAGWDFHRKLRAEFQ